MNPITRVFILILSVNVLGGCASPNFNSAPSALRSSGNLEETWDLDQFEAHLSYFNSPETEGRSSGSAGFLLSAAYISTELESFGLQPIQVKSFGHQYASRVRIVERATVDLIGRDTLQLVHGVDFIIAGLETDNVVRLSKNIREMIPSAGYGVHPQIAIEDQVTTATQHVSGFIPGRHPASRDSLILIVAPLDGLGLQGPNSYTDGTDLGVAATALLEVAGRISSMQQTWSFFKPTIMISFLSGSRSGCEGPENALRNVPWKKSYVIKVIVLSDAETPNCDWPKMMSRNELTSPVIELTAPAVEIPEEITMPFYPLVLREKMIRTFGMARLVQNAATLAQQALDATLR